jgi:hypothetical protein
MEESQELVSPVSVVYYQHYKDSVHLTELLEANKNKIQCIVSDKGWFDRSIAFGEAQRPALNDYADGIDTLKFLIAL